MDNGFYLFQQNRWEQKKASISDIEAKKINCIHDNYSSRYIRLFVVVNRVIILIVLHLS